MDKTAQTRASDTVNDIKKSLDDVLGLLKPLLQSPQNISPAMKQTSEYLIMIDKKLDQLLIQVTQLEQIKAEQSADDVPAFWRKNLDYGER